MAAILAHGPASLREPMLYGRATTSVALRWAADKSSRIVLATACDMIFLVLRTM